MIIIADYLIVHHCNNNNYFFFVPGRVILGSDKCADIPVTGTGVESLHCAIENNNGVVTLYPIKGNTYVDGVYASSPIRLTQGILS